MSEISRLRSEAPAGSRADAEGRLEDALAHLRGKDDEIRQLKIRLVRDGECVSIIIHTSKAFFVIRGTMQLVRRSGSYPNNRKACELMC